MAIILYKEHKINVYRCKEEGKFGYGMFAIKINDGEAECGYIDRGKALDAGLIRVEDIIKGREIKYIALTKDYMVTVNAIDYPWLIQYYWQIKIIKSTPDLFYATSARDLKYISMHVEIIKRQNIIIPKKYDIHHIDGNGLNDFRENLEVISKLMHARIRYQQKANSSGANGVNLLSKGAKRYNPVLRVNGVTKLDKCYYTLEEGLAARLKAEKEHYKLNQGHIRMEFGIYENKTFNQIIKIENGLNYLINILSNIDLDIVFKMRLEFFLKDIGALV